MLMISVKEYSSCVVTDSYTSFSNVWHWIPLQSQLHIAFLRVFLQKLQNWFFFWHGIHSVLKRKWCLLDLHFLIANVLVCLFAHTDIAMPFLFSHHWEKKNVFLLFFLGLLLVVDDSGQIKTS